MVGRNRAEGAGIRAGLARIEAALERQCWAGSPCGCEGALAVAPRTRANARIEADVVTDGHLGDLPGTPLKHPKPQQVTFNLTRETARHELPGDPHRVAEGIAQCLRDAGEHEAIGYVEHSAPRPLGRERDEHHDDVAREDGEEAEAVCAGEREHLGGPPIECACAAPGCAVAAFDKAPRDQLRAVSGDLAAVSFAEVLQLAVTKRAAATERGEDARGEALVHSLQPPYLGHRHYGGDDEEAEVDEEGGGHAAARSASSFSASAMRC